MGQIPCSTERISCCLTKVNCDFQLAYQESQGAQGRLMSPDPDNRTHLQSSMVACFPLHALLVAMNRTTVDYFSLDVEGYELDVSRRYLFSLKKYVHLYT